VFRDFGLDPSTPVGAVCDFYNLPPPPNAEQSLRDWMRTELRRPPVVGDCVRLGPAMLAVGERQDGRITRIGLGLLQ
jgi:cell volume regulation protein A